MRKVSEIYSEIRNSSRSKELFQTFAYAGLTPDDTQNLLKKGFKIYDGKVRHLLEKDGELRILHSDRLSAFDRFIGLVPFKGTILTAISEFWFKKVAEEMPTHFLSKSDERTLVVKKLEPIKIEVIVRGYLAGSMMRAYEAGERLFCGERLPENLGPYQILPKPIITPTTKAEVFQHDENTTPEQLVRSGICTEKEWEKISAMAFALFSFGSRINEKLGWILVDTKYEFGRDAGGEIYVIDEIHTPDSSRFWHANSYKQRMSAGEVPQMLDKEIVRRYLMDRGFKGEGHVPDVPIDVFLSLGEVYLKVAEALIGGPLYTSH